MRWRKVAGGVLGGIVGLLLGLSANLWIGLGVYWLDFPPGARKGFLKGFGQLVTAETVWIAVFATAVALALAGVLYWLGKRLEG